MKILVPFLFGVFFVAFRPRTALRPTRGTGIVVSALMVTFAIYQLKLY
jgi:hypothetical protein